MSDEMLVAPDGVRSVLSAESFGTSLTEKLAGKAQEN